MMNQKPVVRPIEEIEEGPALRRRRHPFDFPFFPAEPEIEKRAEAGEVDALLAEFAAEGDQQSARANALFTAGSFALAGAAVVRAAVGMERWQYGIVIFLAAAGIITSLVAQVTRVGKLAVGFDAEVADVLHSYSAVRRRARWLEVATWTVGLTLALLALFVLTSA
jgi:hypothetical protein